MKLSLRKLFSLAMLTSLFLSAQAQSKVTLSGTLRDAETGETLIGATVFLPELNAGSSTNEYGFYSVSVDPSPDSAKVIFSYVGYQDIVKMVKLDKSQTLNLELGLGETLEEIVVEATGFREKINSTQMSVTELTAKEAKILPAFLGEVDILKTVTLKPGVLSGGEGLSGVFVRGGGPDQNLFLLDEAPVYNPSHLFGFFSTFNNDAVKSVDVYKGGFPAQYGGKLSSVFDVRLNEGNRKNFAVKGGVGLISSRLTVEGPILKDKISFIVSGRRTYADVITRTINNIQKNNENFTPIPDYYFYDLNAKINYDISDKDKLYLSGYFGRDVFKFSTEDFGFNFDWGNATITARWNHIFKPKLFSNTVFTFSDYKYKVAPEFQGFEFQLGSGIRDYNLKTEFGWFPTEKHVIKFGANAIYHTFRVNNFEASSDDGSFELSGGQTQNALELGAWLNDDFKVSDKFSLNYGLRLSGFNNGKFYYGIEPRVSAKYSASENVTLKASYNRMYQYLHLVASSAATLPTDVWYPSNKVVPPQSADQIATGVNWLIGDQFLWSGEVFYKWLHNQIDFRNGAQLIGNDNLDAEFVTGKGTSYGFETYFEKKAGKFTGWVSYTLSWSWRVFDELNNGVRFHPRYDRRNDISVVLMWEATKRITFSAAFVFGTGNAFSLPDGRAFFFDQTLPNSLITGQDGAGLGIAPIYTERNKYRLPANHRLDLGMVWKIFKPTSRIQGDLTFSAYNTYDRRNPFFIFFAAEDNNDDNIPDKISPKVVSLFPIIPAVTLNFNW